MEKHYQRYSAQKTGLLSEDIENRVLWAWSRLSRAGTACRSENWAALSCALPNGLGRRVTQQLPITPLNTKHLVNMRFAFAATVVALVAFVAAAPSPVQEKRLSCYNKCMQGCSPPGSGACSIYCGKQCPS
ncbi:hypothetical protein BDV93DRAFT_551261 [Ceratobasidium sp. AG-I]|nr:hypothetical protein BDV93DRAFT_551261 [Ceratobasidium sp. AG-I]